MAYKLRLNIFIYYKGGNLMKTIILKILLLTFVVFAPVSAIAGVSVHINIPLPPPIIFPAPPELVVIPETDVYAVPDVEEDMFFYAGWWWRPWEGRWYRSHYYDRGWILYRGVPSFHRKVPVDWRDNYKDRRMLQAERKLREAEYKHQEEKYKIEAERRQREAQHKLQEEKYNLEAERKLREAEHKRREAEYKLREVERKQQEE
jgi:hypothetical protein